MKILTAKKRTFSFFTLLIALGLNIGFVVFGVGFLVNNSNRIRQQALAASATHFVSTSGNDTYPGTQAQPWKTLKKASLSSVPGDVIMILPGTYFEKLAPQNSGTSGNYITFMADPGTVTLDGSGVSLGSSGDGMVQILGKSYIKVSGLIIKNSSQSGVNLQADASSIKPNYVEITRMSISNTNQVGIKVSNSTNINLNNNSINYVKYSSGIGVWTSDHVVVDHNMIVNAHVMSEAAGGHEESLSVANTTNFEVSNNDVSMNGQTAYLGNEGIDIKEASRYGKVHHNYIHDYSGEGGALYVDAWKAISPSLSNIDIYSNFLKNTANGINIGSEQGGTAENINVYNNLVYNTGSVGIGVPGRTGDGLRRNVNIYNNTIYKSQYNGGAGIYVTSGNISNIGIRNNIVYFNNSNGEILAGNKAWLANIKADHNLVFGPKVCSNAYPNCVELSNNPSGYSGIFGNVTADPKFANISGLDFRLQASSPAIDRGMDLRPVVTADYQGLNRPLGSGFDMGAFEYGVLPTATPMATPTPEVVNILKNPSLESATSPWILDASNGTVASLNLDKNLYTDGMSAGRVDVTTAATTAWYAQFFQDNLAISAGNNYKISFMARSSINKTVQVAIQKVSSPYTQYLNKNINLVTSWQRYTFTFTPTVSDANVKLTFFLGNSKSSTWFDNFYFGR